MVFQLLSGRPIMTLNSSFRQITVHVLTAWYNDRNGIWFDNSQEEETIDDLEGGFFMRPDEG